MGEPKGNIVVVLACNPDGELRAFEVDASDFLKVIDQSGGLKTSELEFDASNYVKVIDQSGGLKTTELRWDASNNVKVNIASPTTHIVKPHADEKLFGIESVVNKTKNVDATTTWITFNSVDVPDNKIWKITHISFWNEDGDIATGYMVGINGTGVDERIYKRVVATARYITVNLDVELYLVADDYITITLDGIASPETVYLRIFGYEMNAP